MLFINFFEQDCPKANLPITIEIDHCHIIAKGGRQARPRED